MSNPFSRAKNDMHYLFAKKANLTRKNQRRKKRAISLVIGFILVVLQLVAMILFLLQIFKLDILPMKYLIILNLILVLLLVYNFLSQFSTANIIGKLLSILLSGIMVFGFLVSAKVNTTLDKITDTTIRTDIVDIVVLAGDSANSLEDTLTYTYGYNSTVNKDTITKAIEDINADYSASIEKKDYDDWSTIVNALYDNKEIKALAVADTMYASLKEQFSDFSSKTKVAGTVAITTEVKLNASDKKINEEAFIMYMSGNDEEGTISSSGRSDVNLLAVCNPVTRQILLISTPRDSYINISDGKKSGLDKLTHASNTGIEYSMKALEDLYGYTPDYYLRVNFTGCINIVDALGGITINSDVEFSNGWEAWDKTFHYNIGPNECDGEKTLAFVRERKAFANGDFQRGRNQEAALEGIINKITSPAILTNYAALLDSISDMMLTNMPVSTISSLVKGQLNDSTPWTIQSYSITGTTGTRTGQVWGLANMSVVFPDSDSINLAIQLMSKTINGEVFDIDTILEEQENSQNTTSASTKAQ